jgi:hypothetical protein
MMEGAASRLMLGQDLGPEAGLESPGLSRASRARMMAPVRSATWSLLMMLET